MCGFGRLPMRSPGYVNLLFYRQQKALWKGKPIYDQIKNRLLSAELGEGQPLTKHLRNFRVEIRVAAINEPAAAQSGAGLFIMNALQV